MTARIAARYVGDRRIDIGECALVSPGPGMLRIDVAYTGICGTDLHIVHGAMDGRVQTPAVLGHEMAGRVAETGSDVSGWSVGDPVTVMPLVWCGTCPACLAGNRHVCQRLTFVGIDSPGSMQQSWTVPSELVIRIPEGTSLRDGALVEPTAVAVHDVGRAGVVAGEKVLVVGGGPVGLLVAVVARHVGAEVLVVEIQAQRRSIASRLGFAVLDPGSVDVRAHVEEWTAGAGVDVAFEVAGSPLALEFAVDALKVRGRLVVVAIHPKPQPVDLFRLFWRELSIIGARVYETADFQRAATLIGDGIIPVDELVSAVVPLPEAEAAFGLLESGQGVMKVLVDCSPDHS